MNKEENRSGKSQATPGSDRRKAVGRQGEAHAEAHLVLHGFRILDRNWRCRSGELDLIAEKDGQIVIVEVRTRTASHNGGAASLAFGTPQESVDARKQRQVRETSIIYLSQKGWGRKTPRFDMIAVLLEPNGNVKQIEHIPNAF